MVKLDKIGTDGMKVNLKNDGPTFFKFKLFHVNVMLRNYLCLLYKRDSIFELIFLSHD